MDGKDNVNTDALLEELGGCGRFQIILHTVLIITAIPMMFNFSIDTFGTYNPGWRCLDNDTVYNETTLGLGLMKGSNRYPTNTSSLGTEYEIHSCQAYESCRHVEFNPAASTIVTEWGLTCDRGWVLSTILSLKMIGSTCSCLLVGYVGDRFGRRIPFFISRTIILILNLITIFSTSWQMYAVLSFLAGFVGSFRILGYILGTEYVSPDWRIKITSLPTWSLVSIVFSVVAMFASDWRTLRWIIVVMGLITLILQFWIPKSLRWVSVNGDKKDVMKIVKKVSKYNKTALPQTDLIDVLVEKNKDEKTKSKYTMMHLFRKGYLFPTLISAFVFFTVDLIYFAFHYGIAALPGDFYTNFIVFSVTDLPANIISFTAANRFNRKPSMVTSFALSTLGIFGIVALDLLGSGNLKVIGTIVLVMVSKLFIYVAWIILYTAIVEFYPTVIRSTISGFSFFVGSIGGVAAPYLIPTDPSTFYICYLAMGILALACTICLMFFPETKGKPLKDTWGDDKETGADGHAEKANGNNLVV